MEKKLRIAEQVAVVQKNGRYAVAPHAPGGFVTPQELRKYADIAEKYQVDAIKMTSAERFMFIGIDEERLGEFWQDVGVEPGQAIGACIRSVKFCPGTPYCTYAKQNAYAIGMELDKRFHGKKLPFKFKIGVSGCHMQCAENAIKDFALYGTPKGWKAAVGGNGGLIPRIAQPLADQLSDEQALELTDKVISVFEEQGPSRRIGKWIEEIGLDEFKKLVGLEK